ncbi:hypothetical protein [Aeromicrobium alkaliterrae]|uniref:Uncharacterized protein n=1 Tax=Aeromicrobium alkaliterrae TaxID=302168 RepID=A0ABN2JGH4_9ACTN
MTSETVTDRPPVARYGVWWWVTLTYVTLLLGYSGVILLSRAVMVSVTLDGSVHVWRLVIGLVLACVLLLVSIALVSGSGPRRLWTISALATVTFMAHWLVDTIGINGL